MFHFFPQLFHTFFLVELKQITKHSFIPRNWRYTWRPWPSNTWVSRLSNEGSMPSSPPLWIAPFGGRGGNKKKHMAGRSGIWGSCSWKVGIHQNPRICFGANGDGKTPVKPFGFDERWWKYQKQWDRLWLNYLFGTVPSLDDTLLYFLIRVLVPFLTV